MFLGLEKGWVSSPLVFFGDVFQSESTAFIPKAKPGKLNAEPENVSWENEKHLPANHYFLGFHVFSFFFRMCSEILSWNLGSIVIAEHFLSTISLNLQLCMSKDKDEHISWLSWAAHGFASSYTPRSLTAPPWKVTITEWKYFLSTIVFQGQDVKLVYLGLRGEKTPM